MSDCCCVAAAIRPGFAFHRAAREAVRLSVAASAAVAALESRCRRSSASISDTAASRSAAAAP